jgi:hypothetical protein
VRYSALLLLLLFCSAPAAGQGPWMFRGPLDAHRTGTFADTRLDESSGVAASRRYPGMLWTHNDGTQPLLFATDTTGAARGIVRLRAEVDDWEDIALGPCGRQTCLYLADTGDNRERRRSVRIHRLPEPDPATARRGSTAPVEVLHVRYPDNPHDVEAMWVDPNGDVQLVTKGRGSNIRQYRVPAAAWTAGRAVAQRLAPLPIEANRRLDRFVTGAAISPDARLVAVRTYREIYFFERGSNGALVLPAVPLACSLGGIDIQGEGVGWLDTERLVLTSERAVSPSGTVTVLRCPLPPPTASSAAAARNR